MPQIHKPEDALTLVELMIAMIFVSFLLGAVWMVYNVSFKAFTGQTTRGGITPEVERALFELGSDLRQADSVTAAQAASLTITADTDSDGAAETIQYAWDGTSGSPFNKVTTVTRPVVHFVSSMAFAYYDANNNLLSFPVAASQVRRVVITMTVTSGSESFTVRTSTDLRSI